MIINKINNNINGSYIDWTLIDYQPVMKEISLENLFPFLANVRTALDIGCSEGHSSISLAQRDIKVTGVSLNQAEIERARYNAQKAGVGENTFFLVGDILTANELETYDLVMMIRLLTCFPDPGNWKRLLNRSLNLVKTGGLVYIYDFLLFRSSPFYNKRYLAGQEKGWPLGNFEVKDTRGKCLFIAHHHSREEMETIMRPYKKLKFSEKISLSMNGNEAKVFEFIGFKKKAYKRMKEKVLSMDLKSYLVTEAPTEMVNAAIPYETRFGIHFHSLTVFPLETMAQLHGETISERVWEKKVIVASRNDTSILEDMEILGEIANNSSIDVQDRRVYFETLLRIYQKLPMNPDNYVDDSDSLFIGPRREGNILAETMGWLPSGRSLTPDAKRINYKDGLIVGLEELKINREYKRCLIIDGAIGSGATAISIIRQLKGNIKSFHIYSVHAAREGVSALLRYGAAVGIEISVILGHTTSGLNKKFYAVSPGDKNRQVVGDLGDTISEIAWRKQ